MTVKLSWNKRNPKKMSEASARYRWAHPETVKQQNSKRNRRLQRYGITLADLQNMLARQNYSCYGCLTSIDEKTANVDHDHGTEIVRGLLCRSCNWALGQVKDDPGILRRLMTYLDYDRNKARVYLIGSLKNSRIPEVGNALRAVGYDVMDEWYTPGPEADDNWQKYEKQRGRSYAEALRGRGATNIFLFDRSYLDLADAVIMVAPAGKSAMIELGYAKGRGKKTIMFLDGTEPERFEVMPNFADYVVHTEVQLIELLKTLNWRIPDGKK